MLNLGMENSEELLPLTLPLRTLRALQVAVVVKVWVPQSRLTLCHPWTARFLCPENLPANAGDTGLIPGSGRCPG